MAEKLVIELTRERETPGTVRGSAHRRGARVCCGAVAVARPLRGGPCPAIVFVVVLTLAVATTSP